MKKAVLLLAASLIGCTAASRRQPIIEIDNWWSKDYAKNVCEAFAQRTQYVPGLGEEKQMCVEDPNAMLAELENEFLTAFRLVLTATASP